MSGCPHVPHLIAIPTELAIDARHTPCIGNRTRKRIETKFHALRVEPSLRSARAPSLLRWFEDHGIQWMRTKSNFAIA